MVVAEMRCWGLPPALILIVLLLVHNEKFMDAPEDCVFQELPCRPFVLCSCAGQSDLFLLSTRTVILQRSLVELGE